MGSSRDHWCERSPPGAPKYHSFVGIDHSLVRIDRFTASCSASAPMSVPC